MFVSKSGDTMSGELTVNDSLVVSKSHTSTTSALSNITVGNNIVDGTAGSSYGGISLFGKGSRYVRLQATTATSNRTIELPNASGTLALTSEIHWKNRVTGVVASAGSNLKRVDNTNITPSGVKYIVIQSETSNGDSASVYLLNNSAITIVYEGSSNRSPRLFIESSIIKVKTNGHTGGIPMSYMVWEY